MADRVIDYSAGFPGAANIKRAGYIGAVRYIGTPGNIKCATAGELRDFTANGIGMALVFEQYATDWRGGYNAGAGCARRAYDHAKAIGWPAGTRPIYMAVDQDVVTESEFTAAMSYLRGAASVLGAQWTGVYGEHDVCARAAAEGAARWFWQCRAWSGTPPRLFAGRHLYQHAGYVTVGGIQCDYNDVLRSDWGQHLEDDMQLSDPITLFDHTTGKDGAFTIGDALYGMHRHAKDADLRIARTEAKLDALAGTLSDDEADIIAAVRAQPTGGQVDVTQLAGALAPLLPDGVDQADIEAALANVLRRGTDSNPTS